MRSKLITSLIIAVLIICSIPVTTLAIEFQPLELNSDSSGLQLLSVSAAARGTAASSTSAEYLLQGLAENAKTGRILGGMLLVGTGALFIASGASINDEFEGAGEAATAFYAIGGGTALIGLIVMAVPSEPENYYSKVIRISDDSERETAAASYLLTLSSEARFSRLINGITCLGFSIYYFSNPSASYYNSYDSYDGYYTTSSYNNYDRYLAITFAVEALYSLLVKSPAEQAWDQYSAGRGSNRVALQLGVNPKTGGLSLGYNFAL